MNKWMACWPQAFKYGRDCHILGFIKSELFCLAGVHSGPKALNLDQNLTNDSMEFSKSPLRTGRQEMERMSVIKVAVALESKWTLERTLGEGKHLNGLNLLRTCPAWNAPRVARVGASSQSDCDQWGQTNGRLQRPKRVKGRCFLEDRNSWPYAEQLCHLSSS